MGSTWSFWTMPSMPPQRDRSIGSLLCHMNTVASSMPASGALSSRAVMPNLPAASDRARCDSVSVESSTSPGPMPASSAMMPGLHR